jgi:hypothetical protein
MEPLFRLALIRPAVAQDPDNPSIRLSHDSPFQRDLAEALSTERPREESQQVARDLVTNNGFIGNPGANPLSNQLTDLAASLDRLERQAAVSHADVVAAVNQAFDSNPRVLVQEGTLDDPMAKLRDSLLAIKLLQEEHGRPIEALTNQLRDLELIVKVAEDNNFPDTAAKLRRYRRRSLLLPSEVDLQSILSTAKLEEDWRENLEEAEAERRERAEALSEEYLSLSRAIDELTGLGGEHFQTTPQDPDDGFMPPEELRSINVRTDQIEYFQKLSSANLEQLRAAIDERDGDDKRDDEADRVQTQDATGASSAAIIAQELLTETPQLLHGSQPFLPMELSEVSFRLKPEAEEAMSGGTRELLDERNIALAEEPVDRIVESLQTEMGATRKKLELLYGEPVQKSVKRMGDTLVTITTPLASAWTSLTVGPPLHSPLPPLPVDHRIPQTRGKVAPAGVADLLVVRQQLTGYEGADVAHIENVLKGERKQREHTQRRATEELTFRETEITSAEERELESTNRFEMTRETNTVIKEDASLKAGLNVSGKYGPTVEFSASAEGAVSRSKEEATKAASSFSQDVTQRSATNISERVLERSSLLVTTEVIDKNTHELNNIKGTDHISGVYQWVNKVYQAQMFNYGLRTMFDFMVPEPAAFVMEVMKSAHASAVELTKPQEFTLQPSQISEYNYGYWVRLYGATDVTPPPEMYKTKSLDFKAGGGDDKTSYNHSGQIMIDEGYRALQGSVGWVANIWENSCSLDVVLGRQSHRFDKSSSWVWITPLNDERDSIPFVADTFRVSQVAVGVEVLCQRTDRAMVKWQHETHAKLTTAYKARLSEYEEKLASLQVQAGVAIQGQNPAINLEIMKDELKKNCISILTDQHYDLFNAIDTGTNGLPQIDVFEAEGEGAYVRFFEQAFEWEQMTWVTYPYFWGRKSQWDERLAFEDPDPLFNQFLKAGYCRVSVPARLGFEGAIDHFMTYGELWNGGPLPPISSPLYLPIADEIAEQLDRPGDEMPQGDPWLVSIPTTLVHLRADDKLPKWQQDASGNWVEE